jgi:dynein heavy chain
MRSTTEKVEGIQKLMEVKMIDVGIEKEKTNELIEVVGKESLIAEKEADAAAIQQEETEKMTQAAKEKKASCDAELADAIPAMEKAQEAVNCLNVGSIQELKSLGSPPEQAKQVSFAVMILKDGVMKNHNWANAQKMMKDPKKFIDEIVAFDGDNIEDKRLDGLKPLLSQDWFNFEVMKGKSVAAAYLCSWIVNIVGYNTIFKKVKPLKDSADEAQATADAKGEELKVVIEKVRQINEHVDNLKAKLAEAEANKKRVEDEAEGLNA